VRSLIICTAYYRVRRLRVAGHRARGTGHRARGTGHVWMRTEMHTWFWWGNLMAKLDHSEDLWAEWRIILKRVFLEIESYGVKCLHLAQNRDKSKRSRNSSFYIGKQGRKFEELFGK